MSEGTGTKPSLFRLIAGNLVFQACCVFLLVKAFDIPQHQREGELSVRLWPVFLLSLLIVLTLARTIRNVLAHYKGRPIFLKKGAWADVNIPLIVMITVLLVLYPFFMEFIGFPVSTLFFMLAIMLWGGYRKRIPMALHVVGGTVVILYVFVMVAGASVPMGQWAFEDMTIAIYKFLHIY